MKSFLRLTIVLITSSNYACTCITQEIEGRYNSADLVIKGKILSKVLFAKNHTEVGYNKETGQLEKMTIASDKKAFYEYTVEIIELYKGKRHENMIKVKTEAYDNCSANFIINNEYLIFSNKKGRKYLTNLCSGNELAIEEHENKLKKLKNSDSE